MKKLIPGILLFSVGSAFSQITINQNHMPLAGDTIRYSTASALGFNADVNNKGTNRTWDFSTLTASGQDIYNYVAANRTPYVLYFFGQIGLKTTDSIGINPIVLKNIYSFYTKSSTVFKAEGIGYSYQGIPLSAKNIDDDEIYQFPLNFNDSDVSSFNFRFAIPGNIFTYVQAGKRTNIVDGWGSIVTPYKTYSSVLRVKTILDQTDSLITQFAKIPVPRRQVIYKWLSTEERIPVLEVTGTETAGVFTATQIRYRDKFLGLANPLAPSAGFSVNKTSGYVNADTFNLRGRATPFASSWNWQITPTADVQYVGGTTKNSQNPRVVFKQRGLFNVSLTVSNPFGSGDTTAAGLINIDFGVGLYNTSPASVLVYPNPANDILYINYHGPLQIFSATGQLIASLDHDASKSIDISGYQSGLYILKTGNNSMVRFMKM
jgi:PKD repeat protein